MRARDTIIKTRCSVNTAMIFFHIKVLPHLNREHIKLLSETPFFHLFAFSKDIQLCRPMLHHILLRWNHNEECFKFRGVKINFSPEDIALIMALPTNGDPVNYTRQKQVQSSIRLRYFPPTGEISRENLELKILELLLGKEKKVPEADVVGLLIMYLFTTILFTLGSGAVPAQFFHYVDSLDRLWDYSWGKAVYNVLISSIPRCASWCRMMEGENNLECFDANDRSHISETQGSRVDCEDNIKEAFKVSKTEDKKTGKKDDMRGSLSGCAIALMVCYFLNEIIYFI
jgi:hypothetical protein